MTPHVPDLLRELAGAVELYVKHAAAAQSAAAERDRVSELLREAAPELFGGVANDPEPGAAIVAMSAPMQDSWRKRGLEPPPGKLSKNAYATRLGLKSNALSSHKEALDAAVDEDGWLDVERADAILTEKTKEDSILGKAVRNSARGSLNEGAEVATVTSAPLAQPEDVEIAAMPEPAPVQPSEIPKPIQDPLAPPPFLEGWPELSPLAKMANRAARYIRLRDSLAVEPVDPKNREGNWTIGSKVVTAAEVIREARTRGASLPEVAA